MKGIQSHYLEEYNFALIKSERSIADLTTAVLKWSCGEQR